MNCDDIVEHIRKFNCKKLEGRLQTLQDKLDQFKGQQRQSKKTIETSKIDAKFLDDVSETFDDDRPEKESPREYTKQAEMEERALAKLMGKEASLKNLQSRVEILRSPEMIKKMHGSPSMQLISGQKLDKISQKELGQSPTMAQLKEMAINFSKGKLKGLKNVKSKFGGMSVESSLRQAQGQEILRQQDHLTSTYGEKI